MTGMQSRGRWQSSSSSQYDVGEVDKSLQGVEDGPHVGHRAGVAHDMDSQLRGDVEDDPWETGGEARKYSKARWDRKSVHQ